MNRNLLLAGCLFLPVFSLIPAIHAAPAPAARVPAHIATDAEIQAAIVKGIVANPTVMAADLRVRVQSGVVTLVGTVRNHAAREAAGEIARRAPGALEVRNRLRIRSNESPSQSRS